MDLEYEFLPNTALVYTYDIENDVTLISVRKKTEYGLETLSEKLLTRYISELKITSTEMNELLYDLGTLSEFKLADKKLLKNEISKALDNIKIQSKQLEPEIAEAQKEAKEFKDKLDYEIYEKEYKKFLELLKKYDLSFYEYIFQISEWLIANEGNNVTAAFTAYMTTILGLDPIWLALIGGAGSGKTATEEAALSLIPDDSKIPGEMTWSSMFELIDLYGINYFDKKIGILGDLGGPTDMERLGPVINVFKEMGSDKKPVERIKQVKQVKDGATIQVPKKYSITGKSALTFTTVNMLKDTQHISRSLMLQPQSKDKEYAAYKEKLSVRNRITKKREKIIDEEIPLLHSYIKIKSRDFEDIEIINPYFTCLKQWVEELPNMRRSLNHITDMVKVVTYMNMKPNEERYIIDEDGIKNLISSWEDNIIVAQMVTLYDGLSPESVEFYNWLITKMRPAKDEEEIESLCDHTTKLKDSESGFTVSSIKRKVSGHMKKFQREKIADYCKELVDTPLLDKVDEWVDRNGYNLYILTSTTTTPMPIENKDLTMDIDMVSSYVKNNVLGSDGIGMVLHGDLTLIIENDDIGYSIPFGKMKLPPWSVRK